MKILSPIVSLAARLKFVAGWNGEELEEFQSHLLELGLLSRPFELQDYVAALIELWKMDILLQDYHDSDPLLESQVLREGAFGAIGLLSPAGPILIQVRESYKYRAWPTYERVVYHELAHPARRHRGEQTVSSDTHDLQERQATQWANWLVLASREPSLFSREATQTIT